MYWVVGRSWLEHALARVRSLLSGIAERWLSFMISRSVLDECIARFSGVFPRPIFSSYVASYVKISRLVFGRELHVSSCVRFRSDWSIAKRQREREREREREVLFAARGESVWRFFHGCKISYVRTMLRFSSLFWYRANIFIIETPLSDSNGWDR